MKISFQIEIDGAAKQFGAFVDPTDQEIRHFFDVAREACVSEAAKARIAPKLAATTEPTPESKAESTR